MFNSINYCDVTQPATPTKNKSNNGFWTNSFMRPRATVYSTSLYRIVAEFKREQRLAAAIARLAVQS